MELSGKKILLLGFGGEARAALRYIRSTCTDVTFGISDQSAELRLPEDTRSMIGELHLGEDWLTAPESYDVIIRTPGVALSHLASLRAGNPKAAFTSGTNLFLKKHAKRTWAVTGTKGKSTTSSLLAAVLRDTISSVAFGGNIGIPALSLMDNSAELFVLELSSYQLEDCDYSPHGAIFLNLFAEHLDHHQTHEAYGIAKANIAVKQNAEDVLVLPADNSELERLTSAAVSRRIYAGSHTGHSWIEDGYYHYRDASGSVLTAGQVDQTRLKGPGNRQNILAVLAALSQFKLPEDRVTKTISTFAPLPHRLEEIGTIEGVSFVNDSISTVPEATINALETFGKQVKTLILGGFDRGISFDSLAEYLASSAVETILLFSPSGARMSIAIRRELSRVGRTIQLQEVKGMEEAVTLARELTPAGSTCLLSPASPSFPLFKNFEHRGNAFRELVQRHVELAN